MSMFDYFKPEGEQRCPSCGRLLTEWQGKDGPCALFVWKEGEPSPIDQVVPEELRLDVIDLKQQRLPATFLIYSFDCPDHKPVEADCQTNHGVWTSTIVRRYVG